MIRLTLCLAVANLAAMGSLSPCFGQEQTASPQVALRLERLLDPKPLLADYPKYVEPLTPTRQFRAPKIVSDQDATLQVRAWRFSYHARGVLISENQLRGDETAVVVVHPWGIDDGQGWRSPKPAGVAFFCTPEKNAVYHRHVADVLAPFLKRLRPHVREVVYSLPGSGDELRTKQYRSVDREPTQAERHQAQLEIAKQLDAFNYQAQGLPSALALNANTPVIDYFQRLPALDAGPTFNNSGFWQLPIPVVQGIDVAPRDVVAYDAEGYAKLRNFLKDQGVRHVLLAGYATDMCVCSTMAGYENLRQDFNVFLVGDATLATFPASRTPRFATQASITHASLKVMVTQVKQVAVTKSAAAKSSSE